MHTVRNRQASKTRAEADRSRRSAKRHDAAALPKAVLAKAPRGFPADLIVPPHRGSVITSAFLFAPDSGLEITVPVATGSKAIRKAERRAAAQARAASSACKVLPGPAKDAAPESLLVVAEPAPVAITADPPAEPLYIAPLGSGRALVPRRQGFVDVIAFALRDSGRRLARWSSARRRADDMKEKLARAEARMRAMEAQLVALQALQERVRKVR